MKIGIRAENKNKWERRVPLVPEDLKLLADRGIAILVQSSSQRGFRDEEFLQSGIPVQKDLTDCNCLFGLKEIPPGKLEPGKIYFIFSHVIKGQDYNMPMLRRMMELGNSLIDYECVVDDQKRRLIFFGYQAGIAGMINSLWAFGRRLTAEHVSNPFDRLLQAKEYQSLDEARKAVEAVGESIKTRGVPPKIHPLIVGFAGYGNVYQGTQEIFNLLPVVELTPAQIQKIALNKAASDKVIYKVVFREEHLVTPKELDHTFDLTDYYNHGSAKYVGVFDQYIDFLSMVLNCTYWDERYPRLLTLDSCKKIWKTERTPKLKIIGDISCDIGGAIQCTVKPSYPDNPLYVYHPETGGVTDGVTGNGPVIMAVEILPSEIPRESSTFFSNILRRFIPDIYHADFEANFDDLKLPAELKRAVILHKGALTPDYQYLQACI